MKLSFNKIYTNKKVLITGHTGFKGSWLSLWLKELGARVLGYSMGIPTNPNHFELLNLGIDSIIGDIRDRKKLESVVNKFQPQIVFNLAAQSIVRYSYQCPIETFETNVIGAVNIFDICRKVKSVKGIVNITSDKCYLNKDDNLRGYSESDPIGGYDPYSASKGCAELVTSSFRESFFNSNKKSSVFLASARAGNAIGGGDWSQDRLIPDIMRAVSKHKKVTLRNPMAIRPWQHVLEPLYGYLLLGQKLLEGRKEFAQAWNFGPDESETLPVIEVVKRLKKYWNAIDYKCYHSKVAPYEAHFLKLNCSKAHELLNWKPKWGYEESLKKTSEWYRNFYEKGKIITRKQLLDYINS